MQTAASSQTTMSLQLNALWTSWPARPARIRSSSAAARRGLQSSSGIRPNQALTSSRRPDPHVVAGAFYRCCGERFERNKVGAFPTGSLIVLPANTSHFLWAKSGEYATQVSAIGPLVLEYLDPADDPRQQNR